MPAEKVLVVDDAPTMREFIVDYVLQPSGYDVLVADNGLTGLQLARQHTPDLIITDMKMPGLTGLEIAQAIQREKLNIPVILITAEGSEEIARQALRMGFSDYLIKPFTEEELLNAVRKILASLRAQREKARMQAELAAAHHATLQRLKELETLSGVGQSVTAVLDPDQVLAKIVDAAVTVTGSEAGYILLLDDATGELILRASKNLDDVFARTFRLKTQDTLAGHVVRSGEAVLLDEASPQKIKTAYLVFSLVYVPLKLRDRVIGVLGVDNRTTKRSFTKHDQRLLHALSDYAAIAIENARLYARVVSERSQFETILREIEDAVMVVDAADKVVVMNATARVALGVLGGEVHGRRYNEIIATSEIRELLTGHSRRVEVTLEDGRVFNAHLTPIQGVGRVVVMQDITHLKQLDRIKSEFVTAVSHDLRSPLTAILGYVELMGRVGPLNPQQADFARKVQYSAQSITALITDLLDLGRIEAGFDTQKEPTHLGAVVQYVADNLRAQAESKHQQFEIVVSGQLPPVLANPPRLRQLFTNLLENAIKYTPEQGRVGLIARQEGDLILLTVSDNGIGIPPSDQPYIFDKFFRASNSRSDFAGTGLGLSIVKSIVEDHSGRIWVESKPGQGSAFIVMLPRYQDPTEAIKSPLVE
jgi:two-component system NtrC family sensor kinase